MVIMYKVVYGYNVNNVISSDVSVKFFGSILSALVFSLFLKVIIIHLHECPARG